MRATVALITTVATVLHLAFGCCGHGSHWGAPACHGPHHVLGAELDCSPDHDHDHETARNELAPDAQGPGAHQGTVCSWTVNHDCGGCRCAATSKTDRIFHVSPATTCFLQSVESRAIAMMQAARGPHEAWKQPPLSAIQSPLFERLVV